MSNDTGKKRVLILGAGAAGIGAAQRFTRAASSPPGLHITVVDRLEYHSPLPFAWQVVSGSVEPASLAFPLDHVFRAGLASGRIEFRRAAVQSIDVERKVVGTDDGELKWDYLVVALGSTTNFFGMTDVQENSLTLRSLGDAIRIHNRIVARHEEASAETDDRRRRELLTFVVVGGGPTGIELAAAVQDLVSQGLARRYPSLAPQVRVLLVEAQDALLSGMSPRMSELALRRIRARGIHVMLGTRITRVTTNGFETADGNITPSGTIIWVAGVRPAAVVESLPFQKARDGRVIVNRYLEVPSAPGVYVVGDCAHLLQKHGSRPYPPTQQVADRQGPACAGNIIRAVQGKNQRAFNYRFKGQAIYMGRNTVVLQLGGLVFDGPAGALLRRAAYLWIFVTSFGLRTELTRKLGAVRAWISAYFNRRDVSRMPEDW